MDRTAKLLLCALAVVFTGMAPAATNAGNPPYYDPGPPYFAFPPFWPVIALGAILDGIAAPYPVATGSTYYCVPTPQFPYPPSAGYYPPGQFQQGYYGGTYCQNR